MTNRSLMLNNKLKLNISKFNGSIYTKRSPMRIAVLAYGSITRNLYSHYFDAALSIQDKFQESGLEIRTSFQDISCDSFPDQRRLCLLANSQDTKIVRDTKVYYATHEYEDLDLALENFMKREGTENPSHVAIITRPNLSKTSSYCPLSFEENKIKEIEKWLIEKSYDCALLAQFPPRASIEEVQHFLAQDEDIKKRTLIYFLGLPESTQEAHKDALKFLGLNLDQNVV